MAARTRRCRRAAALADLIERHYAMMLDFYGPALGLRIARKHLGWYLDAAGLAPALRHPVLTAATPDATRAALNDALSDLERAAA